MWRIGIVAILLLTGTGGAVAQESGPTMQVQAGFDGYCRSGSWCPLYVVLSNEGADVEGELVIEVDGDGADDPDLYTSWVTLPAHSRKAYHLYVPPTASVARSRPLVWFRSGRDVLAQERGTLSWLDEEEWLYGVVSSDPSALNFLTGIAPGGSGAAVAHLSLEALPPDPLGLAGLRVLILNDVDTTVLSNDQRQALETWIAHGGHLVVGGGTGAGRTAAGLVDLLPVAVGGVRSVEGLEGLGDWVGGATAPGPYAVVETGLVEGEAIIRQGAGEGLILLARRVQGIGRGDFLAFDAGLNPFSDWEENERFWERLLKSEEGEALELSIQNGYNAREAVNSIRGLSLPSTLQLLGFMFLYTLLVGPVNYVILRKMDRRELAWLTIPALILSFTACAYATGFQIRGGQPIVNQLAAVYVPMGTEVGHVHQVVGVFSPRRTDYDVPVESVGVRRLLYPHYSGASGDPLYVVTGVGRSTLTNLRVDIGGIQPFVAEGYAPVDGVQSDLELVINESQDLEVRGTVRNGDQPLSDAILIVGDVSQGLGDLEPGEQVAVQLLYPYGPGRYVGYGGPGLPDQILSSTGYDDDRYRRYQFLQSLFPYDGGTRPTLGQGVYLVGWAEDAPLAVEVEGRPFSSQETAVYFHALPVAGLEEGTEITIPPGLIQGQIIETTGEVNTWSEGFYMGSEAEVVFRFVVWNGVMVQRVDELTIEMQGSSYGSSVPVVSLWNEGAAAWEQLDMGWGSHTVLDAGAYISSEGHVLLRLDTGSEQTANVEQLVLALKGIR